VAGRDEFPLSVKRVVADRVAHMCSNPECRARTSGPQSDPGKAINVGVAAHITAAAPGGPRYDATLDPKARAGVGNAIWLCQNCAKLVDSDPAAFTAELLRDWKRRAELAALAEVGKAVEAVAPRSRPLTGEEAELLIACAQEGDILVFSGVQQLGTWVRAGGRDFVHQDDPAVAAVYLDALDSIRRRGLCRHESGILHVLTGSGFRVARRLKALMGSDT